MTKTEFMKMFQLFKSVVSRDSEDLFSYAPSAHLIGHCGGYELELHPGRIMWEKDLVCLCGMAEKMCFSMECKFYNGSIIIR